MLALVSGCYLFDREQLQVIEPDDGLTGLTISRASGGTATLRVEIAETPETMIKGLMERPSMPRDQGMLFVFAQTGRAPFWMKNTLIPLSIAFIDEGGVIVHIEDMEPLTENLHTPPSDYRYALEVNQGWFRDNGVQVRDHVQVRTPTLIIGNGR
jgi:uncharacterized membrane protein (UPF0127 family)